MLKLKRIIVASRHKSAELAERKLNKLLRGPRVVGGLITARRSDAGTFSSRGRNFTFEIFLKPIKKHLGLFRWSIGITYPQKSKGKNSYPSYTLQGWQGSRSWSASSKEKFTELTIKGLEKNLGYKREKFWFDLEEQTGIENPVKSNESRKLRGTFEITSEGKSKETVGRYAKLADLKEAVRDEEEEGDE